MTWDVLPVCKFEPCLFMWLCNYLVISSYLGFLYITGQQQAASLSVKRSCFAADWFVGFSVKPDGTWFSGCHCGCINSHSHTYPLAKTQVESKDWGEGKMAHRQAERRSSVCTDMDQSRTWNQNKWPCIHPKMLMRVLSLPGHGSLLLFFGPHPLLEVLQFFTGLQLQPQLALILGRTYDITKEGWDIKATRFHKMH